MNKRACSSDLAVRERRGLLAPAERVALEAHLTFCDSCRMVLELGRIFDAPDAPELDDGARITRLARAAETWTKRARSPRQARTLGTLPKRGVVALAAALVLGCGVAAAALRTQPWLSSLVPVLSRPEAAPGPAAELRRWRPRVVAPVEPEPAPPEKLTAEAPALVGDVATPARSDAPESAPPPKAHHSLAAANAPEEDATAIFRGANDARRRGDINTAAALYRKLQRRFPNSAEAGLSSVPLGELLLARDQPKAALEQFDRPSGVLAGTLRPEALYGRARSLAALGDEAGEKRAWTQLLQEFPKCPYAEAARRRLGASSSSDASGSP